MLSAANTYSIRIQWTSHVPAPANPGFSFMTLHPFKPSLHSFMCPFPGVATAGEDFTYIYEVISLAPGEQTCVDIPILDDLLYEGPVESFEVLMTDLTNSNFSYASTSVFIIDDDSSECEMSHDSTYHGITFICYVQD